MRGEEFQLPVSGVIYHWAEIKVGTDPFLSLLPSRYYFRVYAQVNFNQIGEAVTIIQALAQRREQKGKFTYYKFLTGSLTAASFILLANVTWDKCNAFIFGRYEDTAPDLPVIAIYCSSLEESAEIRNALAADPGWAAIEEARNGNGRGPRRAGTSAHVDPAGREWRTIGYRQQAGYAEDVLAAAKQQGTDWRHLVEGCPTTTNFKARG